MSFVRRSLTALTAAVLAVVAGSTPAFAGPAPILEPEPAPPVSDGSAGAQILDGLLPVFLVLLAVVLVAVTGAAAARIQHRRHLPTTA